MRKVLIRVVLPLSLVVTGVLAFQLRGGGAPAAADWADALRAAAAGADRVVVRDQDFFGKGAQPDREVRGADKVRELFALIDVDASRSGFHCMCDGEYGIHVFK